MGQQTEEIKQILRDFRDAEDENKLDATARKLQEVITGIEEVGLYGLNDVEFGDHLKSVADEMNRRRMYGTHIDLGYGWNAVFLIKDFTELDFEIAENKKGHYFTGIEMSERTHFIK